MNIVYCVTKNYIERCIPSIKSLINYNPKARIFIVTECSESPVELPCKAEIIDISNQDYFTPANCINYGNMFTYVNLLKVCYSDLLPVNKVIHMDADTIINDSLDPFWKTDIAGKWFAAVPEYTGKYKPFGNHYYNMGIALINLQQMRKDKIQPAMIDYLCSVKQPWADQDAWNKYSLEQDKAVAVDVRYNECFATGYTKDPAIIHYCGIKDWYTNRNINRIEYLDKYR